jgi:hypothetical protein
MSRTAAAILGLTLVALSIGFNTVRYPAVWDMSGPAQASESAPAVAASPSERTEGPTPALPQPAASPPPAAQAEANPSPQDRFAADRSAPAETASPGNADSAAFAGSIDASETRRPLVPVMSPRGNELASSVRRLPPVDRAYSNRTDRSPGNIFAGPTPVYPKTGI